ncbi:MAG: right-handed parallel beta-helix repeat-containing protein [Armatimonadetes bacterium]|nr:right-handed parallel beta-helix repeat-containing protein [Armatimonadota bacterium]
MNAIRSAWLVAVALGCLIVVGCSGGGTSGGNNNGGGGGNNNGGGGGGSANLPTGARYDIGNPAPMVDLFVSPTGNDANSGRTRQTPVQTLLAAWNLAANFAANGWRINLLPGTYPFDDAHQNDYSDRAATAQHPLIIQPADGAGTATINGGLNLRNVQYLYLLDLRLVAGGAAGGWGNNVLHYERGDHCLVRGCTILGQVPADFQETFKANQCSSLFLEDNDISGCFQADLDCVSTVYGHILNNRLHDGGEWGCYVKGGSAYLRIEANEVDHCGLGIQTGEGSGLEFMVEPWLHYEAYDIKIVNNLLHDIAGVGLSASGGYNILFAHNTLYRVAISTNISYGIILFVHGSRSNDGNTAECARLIGLGGWGTTTPSQNAVNGVIPNRHVFVYNNLVYNPPGTRTMDQHFDADGPTNPTADFQNLPNPSFSDDDVRIFGNLIFNGPANLPLGLDNAIHIDQAAVVANNEINTLEPQLVSPVGGDYRPTGGGNVANLPGVAIPDFTWTDAPTAPLVPQGSLANAVPVARDGVARVGAGRPGAY